MLNSKTLRVALKTIFGVEDKYLVPLDQGWYVPTYDQTDKVGTWIGYRIMDKKPNIRTYQEGSKFIRSIKVNFRISFIGPQAEELCDQTILWDDRDDVQKAFAGCDAQINYNNRQCFSYPVKNGGLNDNLCWCVDFSSQTFYVVDANWSLWKPKKVDIGGEIITGGING